MGGAAAAMLGAACGSGGGSTPDPSTPQPLAEGASMFDANGVNIAYTISGTGYPLVLLHGWASSYEETWRDRGWEAALSPVRQVIGVDQRGHGGSDKPLEPSDYASEAMGGDVIALLDHLGVERTDLYGYSMGGQVATWLLANHSDRFRAVIVGGIGPNLVERGDASRPAVFAPMAAALLADDPETITSAPLRAVRDFYAGKGEDLRALAAWLQSDHFAASREELAQVSIPVLVANAAADAEGEQLAAMIAGAQFELTPGTDHGSVLVDERYRERVLRFLLEVDG